MSPWLVDYRLRVEEALREFFAEKRERARAIDPALFTLVAELDAFTMRGGKRLRGALFAAGYASASGDVDLTPSVLAGAALELLQTYLLIHDDWMDGDDTRRGGPSAHASLRAHFADVHVADSVAILAGDLASSYAWELLRRAPFANFDVAARAFAELHEDVIFGQHLDVVGSENVALVGQLKTGSYTVRGPLRLGAILGGATEEQLAAVDAFSAPLGLAFQLRDDLLGTFGNAEKTGKSADRDLRSGKRTALVAEAFATTTEAERAPLTAVLGREDATPQAIDDARVFLERSGVRSRVEARLERELAAALHVLGAAPFSVVGKERLEELARLLTRRET